MAPFSNIKSKHPKNVKIKKKTGKNTKVAKGGKETKGGKGGKGSKGGKNEKAGKNTKNSKMKIAQEKAIKRILFFQKLIQNTIKAVDFYKTLDIIGVNEFNTCIISLEKLFEDLVEYHALLTSDEFVKSGGKSIDLENIDLHLQRVNNELTTTFKNYGTYDLNELITVLFGNDYLLENINDDNKEIYEMLRLYTHPINLKIIPWQKKTASGTNSARRSNVRIVKNRIVEDFMIVEKSQTFDCFDLARTSKNFQTKVYGIKIALQNKEQKKTVIVNALVDDLVLKCVNHPFIRKRKESMKVSKPSDNDFSLPDFDRFVDILTLKELLIYNNNELYNRYIGYLNQSILIKQKNISQVVKEFLNSEPYAQRTTMIQMLMKKDNPEYQYLAYLLYDLLTNDQNNKVDTNEQTMLFDSLPWEIKKYFRDAMLNTKRYTKNLSNFDNSKIPLEQQICLMKASDKIKEKAMVKFKEIKVEGKDSGSKARSWLEGILKIPFGTFKKEPVLQIKNQIKKNYVDLIKDINNLEGNEEFLKILSLNNSGGTNDDSGNDDGDSDNDDSGVGDSGDSDNDDGDSGVGDSVDGDSGVGDSGDSDNDDSDNAESDNGDSNKGHGEKNIIAIKNVCNKIHGEINKNLQIKNKKLLIENFTARPRPQLINNINYINDYIKSNKKKKSVDGKPMVKICHSGKKMAVLKTIIKNYIENYYLDKDFVSYLNQKYKNVQNQISTHNLICDKIEEIHGNSREIDKYVKNVKKTLNKAIHGHEEPKRQIERIIGQWINGEQTGYCFGFEGPPGVGKTSVAKQGLAQCLKDENGESRPFSFIALGGSTNGSTLVGHNYTYVGSTWGRIVDILMDSKCMNPIIYIDELDKVSRTEHGREIIGILTHLIDGTQNEAFQDKYFAGVDLDLSKVLFIFSYNNVAAIDRILLDRIHRVKFKHLSLEDKQVIVKNYLLPEIFQKTGMADSVVIPEDVVKFIIETYTNEAGVRKLKEILFEIISEINLEFLQSKGIVEIPKILNKEEIKVKYLKERHDIRYKKIHDTPKAGLISGLWANSMGMGGMLPIEAFFFPHGSFLELKLTGMQGDVMKESMNVAKTLAWELTDKKTQVALIKNRNNKTLKMSNGIHIHVPEGATPKDGPSGGTAITSAIYSLLNNKKIRNDIAITGEINLQGNVTAIGGLDLKILGGIRAGVKEFLFPKENLKAFDKFMEKYKDNPVIEGIKFNPVGTIQEVFDIIFVK
tara:strand:+ start:5143 stop:8841 length:3699 start_codon:yes stop_codon:yes gene_type:complete